ncbi:type IIG restriction enzyme/methyltransferase [Williamwhitmania taraxaci]|uniref:site-specific DNA-methyltransferase (adenine-specific) n=1 Tax=Williamwhitmania taraxaci TaxID=1640674 RepID=A0A1G6SXU4_9BACT|nr:TaqI-like C-terminal specificity domain-containing protein [Williamwhitmania taraxaci]SDD21076.1 N-6 DNA Methylase [Williamwhitmania taraxaci]
MKLVTQTPKKALKAFLKQKPLRSEIDVFKTNLIALLDKISVIEKRPTDESEEHLKNDLRDFLRDTYYRDTNAINTKDKKDLVIHLGKTTDSEVGIIIEAKRPTNINEMVTADNPNKKALHELILYYLDERNQAANNQLKQLVMTNVNEWFIVDANYFDKHIYRNTQIKKLYETKRNDKKDNPWFYEEIAKIVSKIDAEIPCVYFDIKDYDKVLRNNKKEDDRELIALFKILSPQHLLKIVTPNDSNSLNEKFYKELLHIIGLEEAKENGKNIIRRKKESRFAASLIEATIEALVTDDPFHRLPDQTIYGENKEERVFNVSLELCITWINRILFLKLLEGQLITYHQGNKDYRFLNSETIHDFDELFKLFHKVLAVNLQDRSEAIKTKYNRVPYLNSSLFEISELEDQTIKINSLDNSGQLELIGTTILKDTKKKAPSLPTLDYLFQFLDAYDFASEGAEDVQEDNKTIINASVLGKVFEKINGYKDGSVFTPAFITMYMCKQSIRLAVVEKFNDAKKWDIKQFAELYNKIVDKKEANEIINSLKICDPAVGSGHFLVSALNEIIAVKSELGVLIDEKGKTLRDYEIEIVNDELIITDENGNIFAYNPKNIESNRVQKTLFQEKQTIIENCLFGVDINPNSVKICRLRLWIELLKNAYYKVETDFAELETLPNIDINIKCGNSLLSRFTLDADLSKALKSIKYDVKAYRGFVNDYKNEKSRDVKRGLQIIINSIKNDFRTEIGNNDPKQIKLSKLGGDLYNLLNQGKLFELDSKQKKLQKEKQVKLEADINKLSKEIEEIKSNAIYKNAFEWRFEFPEVLNNSGEFEGFDVVIANPPYVFARENFTPAMKDYFIDNYKTSQYQVNLFLLFIERAIPILKNKGQYSMIIPNSLLMVSSAQKLRKHLLEETALNEIINLMGNTFEGINVETIIISGKRESKDHSNKISIYINQGTNFILSHSKEQNLFMQNEGSELTVFSNTASDELTNKLKRGSEILDKLVKIKAGLKAYESGKGNPKQTPEEVKARPYDYTHKFDKNTYEYLEGKNVCRYQLKWAGAFLKYGEHLAAPRTFDIFNGKKIIIREITGKYPQSIIATYTEEIYLFNMSNIAIVENENSTVSLKYILAILNSRLISHYFVNNTAKSVRQLFPKLILEDLRKFPIKEISPKDQKPFIKLVDKVLKAKQDGTDSNDLEKQIDQLVYKLYDITTEEQKLIEG